MQRSDVRIVAVADIDASRATVVASSLPDARALTVRELLRADDVDVVLNLTTPDAHADIALGAIAAKKSVYGEKPLAATFSDAQRIVAAADAANVQLGCAPDTVLGTGLQTARAVIDLGNIGRPLAATAMMASPGHEQWHPNPDFYYRAGGGPLLDMGPYYVAALVQLLGPVSSVVGSASRSRGERTIASGPRAGEVVPVEVDTHVTGVLTHESGSLSTLTTSFDSVASRAPAIEIHGERASLTAPDPNNFDGDVELRALGSADWDRIAPLAGRVHGSRGIGLLDLMSTPPGQDSRVSGRFALHCLDVMVSLVESADSGRRVHLTTTIRRPDAVPLSRL